MGEQGAPDFLDWSARSGSFFMFSWHTVSPVSQGQHGQPSVALGQGSAQSRPAALSPGCGLLLPLQVGVSREEDAHSPCQQCLAETFSNAELKGVLLSALPDEQGTVSAGVLALTLRDS